MANNAIKTLINHHYSIKEKQLDVLTFVEIGH